MLDPHKPLNMLSNMMMLLLCKVPEVVRANPKGSCGILLLLFGLVPRMEVLQRTCQETGL